MSLRPLISKPSAKALALGVFAMVLIFVLCNVALNVVSPKWSFDPDGTHIGSFSIPLITYLASGAVVGYIAKRSPLMHGALLGILTMGLFAGITIAVTGGVSWEAFFQHTFGAMLVCALGAILGDYVASR